MGSSFAVICGMRYGTAIDYILESKRSQSIKE
jgi:hypothetical protein